MAATEHIQASKIRDVLNYDPDTGEFTWKVSRGTSIKAGQKAGCNGPRVIHIRVYDKLFLAHRLAWVIMTGEWPTEDIDHRDCCPKNNRWSNLRLATHSQNCANRKIQKNNTSGYKGVTWFKPAKRWMAQSKLNGKKIHLGYFDDPETAHAAYRKFFTSAFGEFARTE